MSLATQVTALATRIGTEFKTLRGTLGSNADLTTSAKSTLVGAINEVNAKPAGGAINDTTPSTTTTYSSSKTDSQISSAVNGLIAGAPAAYDTLKEISDYIASDQTAAAGVTSALAKRVAVDAAQSFTSAEQLQGRSNIAAAGSVDVGDTNTNFVTAFTNALA